MRPLRAGWTLNEIVIVSVILVGFVVLCASLILSARERSKVSVEISNMRAFGQAAILYLEAKGEFPTGVPVLVDSGYVSTGLAGSPVDPSSGGATNYFLNAHGRESPSMTRAIVNYKLSYLGFRELGRSAKEFRERIEGHEGAGWLVSLSKTKPVNGDWSGILAGSYNRLLQDGSVRKRSHSLALGIQHVLYMFVDDPEDWFRLDSKRK
jgi:hypothetical protein